MRRCSICRVEKPLDGEHFYTQRGDTYRCRCKDCEKRIKAEHHRRVMTDPVRVARLRVQRAAARDRYRKKNPERDRAQRREREARVQADPVLRERRNELNRINRRLRRERLGLRVRPPVERTNGGGMPTLPVLPLKDRVRQLLRDRGVGPEDLGIPARYLYAWEVGEFTSVNFATADRILTRTGLNWWDVWSEEDYPEVHARLAA